MRIFLSHASEQADVAQAIAIALSAERHIVFFDRSSLPSGETYNDRIREAIAESDLFVFLVSPESVAKGRYTITELELAEQQWSSPAGHVLPVVIRPTEMSTIPVYLKAVTLLEPQGNIPAAVAVAAGRIAVPRWHRRARQLAPALVVLVLVGAGFLARFVIAQRRLASEVSSLLDAGRLQQTSRNYAAAWDWYERAADVSPRDFSVGVAQERLAMEWLENARVTAGAGTFTALVQKVEPVVARCAGRMETGRAADCLAHLGWGDFLRAREGAAGLDPVQYYRRATELDAGNAYGHAMWGFELFRTGGPTAAATDHFAKALAAGRERPYVRSLQLAGLLWRQTTESEHEVIRVINDMRLNGEALSADETSTMSVPRGRLWNIYDARVFRQNERQAFLAVLSPADHLATFEWLFRNADDGDGRKELRLFVLAALQEHAGRRAEALANFQALRQTLARNGGLASGGPLPEQTVAAVKRLSQK